jgi:hypothetical protein
MFGCHAFTSTGLISIADSESVLTRCLKSLTLDENSCVNDSVLSVLSKLEKLKRLSLSECDTITDAGVSHLANYPCLTALALHGCSEITGDGIKALAEGSIAPRSTQLDISCSRMTDDGVDRLTCGVPKLKSLGMRCCDLVSDTGADYTGNRLKFLKEITLAYTGITASGREKLQQSLPNLEMLLIDDDRYSDCDSDEIDSDGQ